ncbi:ThiF family adenylyltransferase [Phycicoccus sp.]|uniref:HesA/MoeB/ThiF family protein n=1 Tax=Phycicoccus sp. TaxID=1902410 RepID=UPI002BE1574E|nr:ThiF family adenylyltransferase [Phycicoccus sp.]HMM95058.1 ThiF family adenylyltransferase [Phycicoccus sp.]
MPTELRITAKHWAQLRDQLLPNDGLEHAAFLICGFLETADDTYLVTQEVVPLSRNDIVTYGGQHISVSPLATARLAKLARARRATLVLCHSHPHGRGTVRASTLDRRTEADLCGRVLTRRVEGPVGALVLGHASLDGAVWTGDGMRALDRVRVIGDTIATLVPTTAADAGLITGVLDRPEGVDDLLRKTEDRVDRQVRAWGAAGQRQLARARVGVVGCGGTGSQVVQQLAHLGVGHLVLVDYDVIESSNLSRIVGSVPDDIGRPKVDVLVDLVHRTQSLASVTAHHLSVLSLDPTAIAELDLVFACTDGHGSRALLNEIAQQFLVPIIDLGVEVMAAPTGVSAGGGVRVLRPGGGCLLCAGTLDAELVRQEYLSEEARGREVARGYLRDLSEPAPSVIALNGVVASLAVLEACHLLAGMFGTPTDRLLYRAHARRLTTTAMVSDPGCHVCGVAGLLGLGSGQTVSTLYQANSARHA